MTDNVHPVLIPCPHHSANVDRGGWTLEHEGVYAGMWVHGDPDCRKPKQVTIDRVTETDSWLLS